MWTLVAANGNRAVWALAARDGSGFELYPAPVVDCWMGEAYSLNEAISIAQSLVLDTARYDAAIA
jgi:hypothetical protein